MHLYVIQRDLVTDITMATMNGYSADESCLDKNLDNNTTTNGYAVTGGTGETEGAPTLRANRRSFLNLLPVPDTKTKEEVPLLFQEPHVEQGFRELHHPWYYYIFSILQLHNESVNVWSHALASALMARKLIRFSGEINFMADPYSWPLLAGMICGICLYTFSAGAHCMQSKSQLFHYTAFMVDYAGIGLYGLGSVIVHLAYCSEDDFYDAVNPFFVPLGVILAVSICFCCTIAKVIYKRPYPFTRKLWQIMPVCGIYIVLISPIFHRLFACFKYNQDCNESIPYHVHQIVWFVASGAFFASDFPQRKLPGKCDYFFHSHQLFHICIMMCTLVQMDGVFIDFTTRRHLLTVRQQPTLLSAFGPVIFTIGLEIITILAFRLYIIEKLKKKKVPTATLR